MNELIYIVFSCSKMIIFAVAACAGEEAYNSYWL